MMIVINASKPRKRTRPRCIRNNIQFLYGTPHYVQWWWCVCVHSDTYYMWLWYYVDDYDDCNTAYVVRNPNVLVYCVCVCQPAYLLVCVIFHYKFESKFECSYKKSNLRSANNIGTYICSMSDQFCVRSVKMQLATGNRQSHNTIGRKLYVRR